MMKFWQAQFTLVFLFSVLLSYQNCTNPVAFDPQASLKETSENNGDPYTGKPGPYNLVLAEQPCSEKGANGKPLPNSQIFLFPSGAAQLVREACQDVTPRPLKSQDYSLNSNGDLNYLGQTFASNLNQNPFEIVATACPVGRTMLANPVRQSLVRDPLELTLWPHEALGVTLEGSLASLPLYRIERNDPTMLESYRRIAQTPLLAANETYVFSFFAKTDPLQKAYYLDFYPNSHDFQVEFDLMTGAAKLINSNAATLLSTQAQAFGGGLFISVYYQVSVSGPANLGLTMTGTVLGSSISATAVQLEKVSNFCAP